MKLYPIAGALLIAGSAAATAADKQLLWGDTHVHTNLSPDAYLNGNYDAGPDVAYQFAKGLPVVHPSTRTRVQLQTPLDFLVVADHAGSMGVFRAAAEGRLPTEGMGVVESMTAWIAEKGMAYLAGNPESIVKVFEYATPSTNDVVEAAKGKPRVPIPGADVIQQESWVETITAADANNDPGNFSAIIGWEWTSIPAGANLHRVIFTEVNADIAGQFMPYSQQQSTYPEDLWRWLDEVSEKTGADFVSIPHNSNISRGFMFPAEKTLRDAPIDEEWIDLRARWETTVEATQYKGDSETDPTLSPEDEFADFEQFEFYLKPGVGDYQPEAGDFVRSALRLGLEIEQQKGQNPYKFGLIGSTDSHTSLAAAEEPNFWGKMASDSTPESKSRASAHIDKMGWRMSASGLAAVWAEENTREAILQAFKRRETYATTGPRIAVRVYAGDFVAGDEKSTDIHTASAKGVPMGGELTGLEKAPSLLIHAAKDPKSAHLDRVQVIKGWYAGGKSFEQVYDVAWSGERIPDASGKVPAVEDTVNHETGFYTNDYGAATLSTVWTDPDFDPAQPAFYYVRVLELPTPRHSTLDAIALGIAPEETGMPVSIQERAYTSPIWYTP